jgi:hypothetical protein
MTKTVSSMPGAGAKYDEAKSDLADFEKKTGFDVNRDLLAVVVGAELSDAGGDPMVALVVKARHFDEVALVHWYEEKEGTKLVPEVVDGARLYSLRDKGGDKVVLVACFVDSWTLVAATSADAVKEMLAIARGKARGAGETRPELKAALRKVERGASLFAAAEVDDALRSKLWVATGKWMGDVVHLVASLKTDHGLDLVLREGFSGKGDAVLRVAVNEGLLDLMLRGMRERAAAMAGGGGAGGAAGLPYAAPGKGADGSGDGDGDGLYGEGDDGGGDDDVPYDGESDTGAGGGGGPACTAYVRCIRALADAYRVSDFPGAADAAKAMEDSAKTMAGMKGDSAETACSSGLDAMKKAADAYKSMPKFKFPAACR